MMMMMMMMEKLIKLRSLGKARKIKRTNFDVAVKVIGKIERRRYKKCAALSDEQAMKSLRIIFLCKKDNKKEETLHQIPELQTSVINSNIFRQRKALCNSKRSMISIRLLLMVEIER